MRAYTYITIIYKQSMLILYITIFRYKIICATAYLLQANLPRNLFVYGPSHGGHQSPPQHSRNDTLEIS